MKLREHGVRVTTMHHLLLLLALSEDYIQFLLKRENLLYKDLHFSLLSRPAYKD